MHAHVREYNMSSVKCTTMIIIIIIVVISTALYVTDKGEHSALYKINKKFIHF